MGPVVLLVSFTFVAFVKGSEAATIVTETSDFRIVGGTKTSIKQHPFIVSISFGGNHVCGGSIISNITVITAAHCVSHSTRYYRIRAGSSYHSTSGSMHIMARVRIHPKYYLANNVPPINDVALVFVRPPFKFSRTVRPINLTESNKILPGDTEVAVLGWGFTQPRQGFPSILHVVKLPIITLEDCRKKYERLHYYHPSWFAAGVICAGLKEGGKDACQGDSGGPLVYGSTLVGIVSYGYGCARPDAPGVYADVAYYRTWIDENSKASFIKKS